MHTIKKQPFYFAGLLIVVQLGNSLVLPQQTVSELIVSDSNDKLGLVKYFKQLELDKFCTSPVLDDDSFKKYEIKNIVPCLCTVIYRIVKELASYNVKITDVELAKNETDNSKFNDVTYKVWKSVSNTSPSLKLLMDSLVDVTQWEKVCYSIVNKIVGPFCKFLNVEVVLLHIVIQTPGESIKVNIVKKPENVLPKTNVVGSLNKELDKKDDQNPKEEDNNDERTGLMLNKEDPINIEDEMDQEKPTDTRGIDVEISTEFKIDSQSNNDYPKEDDGIITHIENKERLMSNQKNMFTNHEYDNTEDSRFFFYFGVMTALSMMFYLALYNKKKIIALLIEGRRSTNHRRRPNTASYSKVETDDGSTVF